MLNAYALIFGGFLMLGGHVADKLGRRRVFVAGVVLFSVASLFCGLATSTGWLVTTRAVQGLGAAIFAGRPLHPDRDISRGSGAQQGAEHMGAIAGAGGRSAYCSGGYSHRSSGGDGSFMSTFRSAR